MGLQTRKKRVERSIHRAFRERACGTCTACCVALAIDDGEIQKEAGERCSKLGDNGCSIYEQRPGSCSGYFCLWRSGLVDTQHRPDRVGVIFDVAELKPGEFVVIARELRRLAVEAVRELLTPILSRGMVVLVIGVDSKPRRIIGPPDQAAVVQDYVRRQLPVIDA